jgi:glutamine amidotransferase
MITVVDYGLGNVRAFLNAYRSLNVEASVARSPAELRQASRVILPGVGAFDHAMKLLSRSGMLEMLEELVIGKGVPVLGICVGMQILAGSSEEGGLPGLSWIKGRVRQLDESKIPYRARLPHMGWNEAHPVHRSPLFDGLEVTPRFYFLHSYHFQCEEEENILARTVYGDPFHSAVCRDNIFGVQFHPEKSHRWGARLLQNFARM